jgi:DNA-binding PadR family transcriptional regulator
MHAYEMYQLLISRQNDRIVKVRPGSLYHTVERLAGQEFVRATGTERAGNRPERTTYELTPAGRAALVERVESGLESYVYEYPVFPAVLSEAHNLDAADAALRLRRRIEDLDRWLDELDASLEDARLNCVAERYWIGGSYIRHQAAAERAWLSTLIDRIESKDLEWLPRNKKK